MNSISVQGIDLYFAQQKPENNPSTVFDAKELVIKGPWKTKSDAELFMLFALPYADVLDYFRYDENELKNIPEDIRGLRNYSVRGLKKGSIGGTEFHRIRKEIILGLDGTVRIELEDMLGNKKNFEVNSQKGLYVPTFVLHTYEALENSSGLLVVANTLFNPEDTRTHDSYSKEMFNRLQAMYK